MNEEATHPGLAPADAVVGPAYRIVTPRLVLRCWEPADGPALHRTIEANAAYLRPWMTWVDAGPQNEREQVELLRRFRGKFDLGTDFCYGIFEPDGAVVGGTGLHTRAGSHAREIGYWIAEDRTRRGYATELTAALTRVGFELDGLQRIDIRIWTENQASNRVPPKVGYRHEGVLRRRLPQGDQLVDMNLWTMVAEEYPASPAAALEVQAFDCVGAELPLSPASG